MRTTSVHDGDQEDGTTRTTTTPAAHPRARTCAPLASISPRPLQRAPRLRSAVRTRTTGPWWNHRTSDLADRADGPRAGRRLGGCCRTKGRSTELGPALQPPTLGGRPRRFDQLCADVPQPPRRVRVERVRQDPLNAVQLLDDLGLAAVLEVAPADARQQR